eukprot:4680651-Prorocentrum_lima.AAC.1
MAKKAVTPAKLVVRHGRHPQPGDFEDMVQELEQRSHMLFHFVGMFLRPPPASDAPDDEAVEHRKCTHAARSRYRRVKH